MFARKPKSTIDSLIGASTRVEGNLHFKGGLRIDGQVKGNVVGEGEATMLVISAQAKIEGEVKVAHLVVNGEIVGPVACTELLELQPNARITGDVHYRALEMHGGALVAGKLTHDVEEPVLKLAVSTGA